MSAQFFESVGEYTARQSPLGLGNVLISQVMVTLIAMVLTREIVVTAERTDQG